MAKFGFVKATNVIQYIKPKVFWNANNGLKFGRSGSEVFRFTIANYKRVLSEHQSIEIYKHFHGVATVFVVFMMYQYSKSFDKETDSYNNSSTVTQYFLEQEKQNEENNKHMQNTFNNNQLQ